MRDRRSWRRPCRRLPSGGPSRAGKLSSPRSAKDRPGRGKPPPRARRRSTGLPCAVDARVFRHPFTVRLLAASCPSCGIGSGRASVDECWGVGSVTAVEYCSTKSQVPMRGLGRATRMDTGAAGSLPAGSSAARPAPPACRRRGQKSAWPPPTRGERRSSSDPPARRPRCKTASARLRPCAGRASLGWPRPR